MITPPYENTLTVQVKDLFHRNQDCLALYFKYNNELNTQVKKIPGATFSKTNQCWYIPKRKGLLNELLAALSGKAQIDYSELKPAPQQAVPPAPTFHEEAATILRLMEQKLHLKGYAKSTAKTYLEQFKLFLHFYQTHAPSDLRS